MQMIWSKWWRLVLNVEKKGGCEDCLSFHVFDYVVLLEWKE